MKNKLLILWLALIIITPTVVMAQGTADSGIAWTAAERAFLAEHPVIKLGVDPRFVPFEFIDDNDEYLGIAADYLALIAEKTGLEFQVQKGLTWPEAYELALTGAVDAMPAIGKTAEREANFLFSDPYYYFKRVIAVRDTEKQIASLDDLAGLAVAVQRNSSHHSYLLPYQEINLSLYDSVEAALTAVATGEEKAFIGNLATTNYLIRTQGLPNLRFIAFEAEKEQALYFAARQDWPELISIFNKTIKTISEKEKTAINHKWIDLETHFDYGPIIRVVAIIAAFFAIVLGVSFFWIARLRKEIRRRMEIQTALEKAKCTADEANHNLQCANEELEKLSMVDGLTGISNRRYFDNFLEKIWDINMRGKFPLALIMIDIDHFKTFNDTHGHLGGDQCLKQVAGAINNSVSRSGDFVARYGGEEFAVLLSNTTEDGAAALAEKIRTNVEKLVIKNETMETRVTVSLGVAAITSNEYLGYNELIDAADSALYQAKRTGRNKIVRASALPEE